MRRRPTRASVRKTSERGYGTEHQRRRRQWAPQVERGEVACARCGLLIEPGEPWDLDHTDHDRTRYLGPSHASCNRSTAGRRAVEPPLPEPLRRSDATLILHPLRDGGWSTTNNRGRWSRDW